MVKTPCKGAAKNGTKFRADAKERWVTKQSVGHLTIPLIASNGRVCVFPKGRLIDTYFRAPPRLFRLIWVVLTPGHRNKF
jgi:hypothetical protein